MCKKNSTWKKRSFHSDSQSHNIWNVVQTVRKIVGKLTKFLSTLIMHHKEKIFLRVLIYFISWQIFFSLFQVYLKKILFSSCNSRWQISKKLRKISSGILIRTNVKSRLTFTILIQRILIMIFSFLAKNLIPIRRERFSILPIIQIPMEMIPNPSHNP